MERRGEMLKLRAGGLTLKAIADRFGVTKERVRQILKGPPSPHKPALAARVMLNVSDVSELLGIHVNTVRRWTQRGILKAYRIGSRGDRRFRREDIDNFLGGKHA